MIKERSILEENLMKELEQIKPKRKIVNQIKEELGKYGILDGDVQAWISSSDEELSNLDIRVLFLLSEAVYKATGTHDIFPRNYFTENEQKESYQYDASIGRETKKFPLTYPNAMMMGNRKWLALLSAKQIKEFLDNGLIYYNFDTQREASVTRIKDKVVIEPTINKKNIEEMTQLMLDGRLESTNLIFNACPRTALSGSEVIYDEKRQTLTLTAGTRLDNVDGYHRSMAIQNALEINPDIDLVFPVIFTNYPTKRAQQFLYQIAQQTPISKVRVDDLNKNNPSTSVVQQLREESDLKISQTHRIHTLNDEMVTFNVLRDSIEEEFGSKMKTSADELDIGDYLVEFFNMVIGNYSKEFVENPEESRKYSLINNSNIIGYGLITLARRMFDANLKARDVRKILKEIDFNKNNSIWEDIGVIDSEGNMNSNTNQMRKAIRKYFNELNIK
jgi:hypothetical protein